MADRFKLQHLMLCLTGGPQRFPQQHRTQVQHHPEQAGPAEQALLPQCVPRSGENLGSNTVTHTLQRPPQSPPDR